MVCYYVLIILIETEADWLACFNARARAFELGKRKITRDPRKGKWGKREFNQLNDRFKMQFFVPAAVVASNWELSKGERDPAIAARVEELKVKMTQLRTDMHNLILEKKRLKVAAKSAGPPPTDSESDDSTYMPEPVVPKKRKQSAPAQAKPRVAVAASTVVVRDNAWASTDRRVSVFERIEGPSTSDGRGAGRDNDNGPSSSVRSVRSFDGPSTSDGRGQGRDRSFSPIRSAVYTNSSASSNISWAEADRQPRSAAPQKEYKLSWNGQNRRLCACCGEDSFIAKCRNFRWLSLSQRLHVVMENRLCHNCFRYSHSADNCRTREGVKREGCYRCQGQMHNSMLCPQRQQ